MVVAAKIDREIKKLKKKTAHTHKPPREREKISHELGLNKGIDLFMNRLLFFSFFGNSFEFIVAKTSRDIMLIDLILCVSVSFTIS